MLTATLAASSAAALNRNEFRIFLRGGLGPSGARTLGRFCHADPELDRSVRKHLRDEEDNDKDAVFAEIVYLPEGRIGNVVCRPVLRDYEITYLGRSGAPKESQLPVSDLLVTVNDGKILLYSKLLRRRIIPRMTNAHGFVNPSFAPVYRFLCYLQQQGGVGIPGFSWGALDSLPFLPRVVFGRVVLASARWRLTANELKNISPKDRYKSYRQMQELRRARKIPRWVLLQEADNLLPVDLNNPLCVDSLIHVLKRTPDAILQEMYPLPDELCVTGPEGSFQHELLIPFVRNKPKLTKDPNASVGLGQAGASEPPRFDREVRCFAPGSTWLYVKLYAGAAVLDEVLKTTVPPLIRAALNSGAVNCWFFVRYADPHQHLRIRFNGMPENLFREIVPILSELKLSFAEGKIWKIQFDTYEREIERYGGIEGMLASEQIFFADSEACLEILESLEGDEGLDDRWQLAILGADRLLSDCGFTLGQKQEIISQARKAHEHEFAVDHSSRKILGERFRRARRRLQEVFHGSANVGNILEVATRAYGSRSTKIRHAARQLHLARDAGKLSVHMRDLALSYIHMHINRLIRSSPRAHELVIYDFMARIYSEQTSRENHTSK